MENEWYVAREGKTFGPFTSEVMVAGARGGQLTREDFIWTAGMSDWQPAADVPALWQAPASSEPAPISAEPQPHAQAAAPEQQGASRTGNGRRRSGLLLRHWRGELTLAKSYWGVGALLTVVVVLLSQAFGALLGKAKLPPVPLGITLLAFLSFLCLMTVWQLVGIWRAAGNHIVSTGRRRWATLARLAVVLGALRAAYDFGVVIWPMLSESMNLARGREHIAAHQLRLLRNGTEMELAGGMPFGTAQELKKLLDAAPGVQVIHLNSIGGRVDEGYAIYQLVRERKLATYTATDCVSACTIAFLGGSQRYLSTKARLGFHSVSFGGVDQKHIPDINADLRRMLAAHGAPPWFIDKSLSTPADSMWYPANQDLIAANIVTSIVDPDQFGLSGIAHWSDKEAIERDLLSIPLYRLVRDQDPEGFKKIAGRFWEAVKLGKSGPELIGDVQAVFSAEILPKYLRVAPDGVIQRYWQTQIAEMEHLNRTDPALCVAFAFPEQRSRDYNPNKLFPAALLAEDTAALAQLIAEASRAPHNEAGVNVDQEFAGVMQRISRGIPETAQVLADPAKHMDNPGLVCAVLVAFYNDILGLPPQRSGHILRAIAEAAR